MTGTSGYIALRYLFSKKKMKFITTISYLSIGGITVGVAALILVLSVFNGFSGLVRTLLVNFDPHVRIEPVEQKYLPELHELKGTLDSSDQIVSYSGFSEGKVLLQTKKSSKVISLRGVDTKSGLNVYNLTGSTVLGTHELNSENEDYPALLVGIQMADKMQLLPGDIISIVSPYGLENVMAGLSAPRTLQFKITGIFSVQNNEYDDGLAFTDLESASYLLGYEENFQGWDIRLKNFEEAGAFADELSYLSDSGKFTVKTWYDFHRELYTMMQIERWVAYILLSLIILVAVFNTLASLTMSVYAKKRDLGILSAMGMSKKSIRSIFFLQGFYIGLIGTIGGFLLALLVYYLHQTYNIYPLDPSRFRISAMPMTMYWTDFVVTGIMSFGLSLFSSFLPASMAASVDPIQAIRYE